MARLSGVFGAAAILAALGLGILSALAASNDATWSSAESLSVPRSHHTATLLRDGDVLVVGGNHTNTGPANYSAPSAERYHAGHWVAGAAMAMGRAEHTATLLPDGRVLVTGGIDPNYQATGTVEIYNSQGDAWTPAASMSVPRYDHTATLLPDGRVLVAGGQRHFTPMATAEIYDPRTNRWTAAGSMTGPRAYHTSTLLPSGKVVVAGGSSASGPLNTVEVYDPQTNRWFESSSMNSARSSHTATLLPDGRVLIVGGATGLPSGDEKLGESVSSCAELLDPSNSRPVDAGCMSGPRMAHTATLLPTGEVLIVGGRAGVTYIFQEPIKTAELYHPSGNRWESLIGTLSGHTSHTATLLPSGEVLIAGGPVGICPPCALAAVDLYRPGAAAAETSGPAPTAASQATDAAAAVPASSAHISQLLIGKPTAASGPMLSPLYLLPIPATVLLVSIGWIVWRRTKRGI